MKKENAKCDKINPTGVSTGTAISQMTRRVTVALLAKGVRADF